MSHREHSWPGRQCDAEVTQPRLSLPPGDWDELGINRIRDDLHTLRTNWRTLQQMSARKRRGRDHPVSVGDGGKRPPDQEAAQLLQGPAIVPGKCPRQEVVHGDHDPRSPAKAQCVVRERLIGYVDEIELSGAGSRHVRRAPPSVAQPAHERLGIPPGRIRTPHAHSSGCEHFVEPVGVPGNADPPPARVGLKNEDAHGAASYDRCGTRAQDAGLIASYRAT